MLNFMRDNKEEDKKSTVAEDFKTGMDIGKKDEEEHRKVADTKDNKKSA